MNWFTWRQHRKQFVIFGVLLMLFAAVLIPTGISYWHTYQAALESCAQNPTLTVCGDPTGNLFTSSSDQLLRISAVLGAPGLPLLLGLFIGAPLIAKEYEEGTNKLAWTQSVSRRKWLTTKLVWVLGFALIYGVLLAILATWWSHTLNTIAHNRFIQGHFESQGLMPIAYSLFFTAIGVMVGAWFRKTLLALAITFGIFIVCMVSFSSWIRPHYTAPVLVTAPMGSRSAQQGLEGSWLLQHNVVDKDGKTLDRFNVSSMPTQCQKLTQNLRVSDNGRAAKVKAAGMDPVDDCLNQAGYREITSYHPSYRYWNFQRIESGIYLGLTILAVGTTYWLVLRRDA